MTFSIFRPVANFGHQSPSWISSSKSSLKNWIRVSKISALNSLFVLFSISLSPNLTVCQVSHPNFDTRIQFSTKKDIYNLFWAMTRKVLDHFVLGYDEEGRNGRQKIPDSRNNLDVFRMGQFCEVVFSQKTKLKPFIDVFFFHLKTF